MNQRAFSAGGRPGSPDEPKGPDAPPTALAPQLERAQVFLECTRAILRAQDGPAIAAAVCQLLVRPGVYAEASVTLFESAHEPPRSFYAGGHKPSVKNPERFWAAPVRQAALERLTGDQACSPRQDAGGECVLRLTLDGREIGALAVVPNAQRALEPDELEKLQALAEDMTCAVSRLREAAPDRSLAISERRLRETVEHAGVGITRIDMNGRFLEVNQKFCEMLGYTREELVGRATRDVTVAEDYGAGAAFRAQAQLGRARMHIGEKRYLRKDGSHLWVRRTMSPAFDENGKVRDVISVVEDITERKRIGQALQDHVERFELAARATSDAIWDWDLTAGTLWWGEGLEKLFDHRREDIGASISGWTDRIHADEVKAVSDGIHAAIDGGASSWSAEYRFRRGDGTWADVYDRAYIMRDEQGRAMRVLGAMMDISERKHAEEAMRRERLLLRAIIDALPDYIHVKGADGRIQLGNKAWLAARRLTDADVNGMTVFDLFPAELAQRMDAQDRRLVATGEPLLDREQPIFVVDDRGNKVQRWSATTKVPMRDEDGRIVGIVGFSRDITTRRRLERERAMEHAVARVLSESRSVEETMPRLIRTICEAMDWSYGAHWVGGASPGSIRRAAWWCEFEPEFDPVDGQYWKEIPVLYTNGLLGKAWVEQ